MPRFKTFADAGTILTSDLNSIQDDYETEYATYLDLFRMRNTASFSSSTGVGTYVMSNFGGPQIMGTPPIVWGTAFWFDPADYVAPARLLKLRLRSEIFVNAVAPATNFVAGLYPIATFGGASLSVPNIASLGTVVAGSTVTYNAPALNTQQHNNSGDFTAPSAAGWYCFGCTNSGTPAANSRTNIGMQLQMRNV